MSKLKYLILCFVLCVIFLGTAYASDDLNQTDTVGLANDDPCLEITNDTGTFEDIQNEIDNADEGVKIDLNGKFQSTGSEIHINKSLTIDGHQNTTLDAKKMSTFFYLDNVSRLSVNGITFINCEFKGDDVTVRWNNGYAGEYVFTNCVFKNNVGYFLEISSRKATFTGCNFTNNDNELFMLDSDDLTVKNCRFVKNTNQLIARAKTIDKCIFDQNYAYCFDLIDKVQSIKNSKFTRNYYMGYNILINSVKSLYNTRFESNKCPDRMIASAGTVDKCVFKANSATIFTKFKTLKNSRFEKNKEDISAKGESVINCKFIGGKGVNNYLKASSIKNSIFKNIKNFYVSSKKLSVKGCQFTNIDGYLVGAKIDRCTFSKSDMDIKAKTITNSKITKNDFDARRVEGDTIKKCQFVQNKCRVETMVFGEKVSNSKFVKNTCGGGVLSAGKSVVNCRFEKNTFAKTQSGYLVGGSKLLKKCVFTSNTGKKDSGVSCIDKIDGCTFKNNKITNYGMGFVYYVKKVLNSKFINNRAPKATGGAIDDVKVVKKCTFKKNYALAGGAISTVGKFTIEKCVFEKNTVKKSGSAIFLNTPYKTQIRGHIKSCKFIKNKAKGTINTYNVPFKSYKNGVIFAVGDFKLKIKISIKNCKGL